MEGLEELKKRLAARDRGKAMKEESLKRATRAPSFERILDLIGRNERGIAMDALKEATGIGEEEIRGTLQTLLKQGKVRRQEDHFYVG